MKTSDVLASIKLHILKVAPGAKVMLFGSRAYGEPTNESDWDILILTQVPVTSAIKKSIHEALFPISVQIAAFINTVTVQEDTWRNSAAYYSLQQSIHGKMVEI